MQTVLKTLLALAIAIGTLALDAGAQTDPASAPVAADPKPTVAFLGLDDEADPMVAKAITDAIRRQLDADSALLSTPDERIALVFGKGLLRKPEAGPADVVNLARVVGARFYAFGKLERISVTSKRVLWMPWSVKVQWDQAVRLRVIDSAQGAVVFDSRVDAAVPEKALFMGPEENWSRMAPLEREKRMRIMAAAVSEVSAKAISKAVQERSAPVAPTADPSAPPPG